LGKKVLYKDSNKEYKVKKTKVTMFKYLEISFITQDLNRLMYTQDAPASICKYHKDKDNVMVVDVFNPFQQESSISLNDIKNVIITTRKELVDMIDLSKYSYGNKKVKIVKPKNNFCLLEMVGVKIPIEIFKLMLQDHIHSENDHTSLRYLLCTVTTLFDICLCGENGKVLGYAAYYLE